MSDVEAGANLTLALYYLEMGRPQQSLAALQGADAAQLEDPLFWFVQGQALYDEGKYGRARDAARKGLARDPHSIYLLYLLCNSEAKLQNYAEAEQAILTALRQSPDDPQILCRYASLTALSAQFEKAKRLLEKARRAEPEHPAIGPTQMMLAYLQGADKEVVRRGEHVLATDPDQIYAHALIGQALAERGQWKTADRFFSNAARLNPTDRDMVDAARHVRYINHWAMTPLWPLMRFGTVRVWLFAVSTFLLLSLLGFRQYSTIFLIIYLALVAYSWIVPPLLRRWLQRKEGRL